MKKIYFLLLLTLQCFYSCTKEESEQSANFDWKQLDVKLNFPLNKVSFVNKEIGFVGGFQADEYKLLKTSDGGKTWKDIIISQANTVADKWLSDMYFVNQSKGFVILGHRLYKTTDLGDTWNEVKSSNLVCDKIVFSCQDTGFSYSNSMAASISYTTDGGVTWKRYPSGTFPKLLTTGEIWIEGVQFLKGNSRIGFLFAKTREIYYTVNGGITWQFYNRDWMIAQQQTSTPRVLDGIFFTSLKEGFIFNSGGISKTTDSGKTFSCINTSFFMTGDYLKVSYIDKNEIYFGSSEVKKTEDVFNTVSLLSEEEYTTDGISVIIEDFTVISSGYGFAVGTLLNLKNENLGVILKYDNQ